MTQIQRLEPGDSIPLGDLRRKFNLLADAIERLQQQSNAKPLGLVDRQENHWFVAKVISATPVKIIGMGDYVGWEYTIRQQRKVSTAYGGWEDDTNGYQDVLAYNLFEEMNSALGRGIVGNGVDMSGTDFPATMYMKDLPAGALVWCRRIFFVDSGGTERYEFWFDAPNSFDGTCS